MTARRARGALAATLTAALVAGAALAAPLRGPAPARTPQADAAREAPEDADDVAAGVIEGTDVPGLAVAVWQGGRLRALGAAGVRAAGEEAPVSVHDRWHLGSCTKAMTAALCALAAERGHLELDATLGALLGPRGYELDEVAATIRLTQLLDHTSGLPANDPELMGRTLSDARSLREVRRDIARGLLAVPPATTPGARYAYSNLGYVVAGVVLEEVFDLDWEALMRRELFAPLGMERAGFGAPGRPGRLDEPRGHVGAGEARRAVPPGPRGDNPAWLGPAGTVHAPLEDWLAFLAMFVEPPAGKPAASRALPLALASLERLRTPAEGRDYALGWQVLPRAWADGAALTHAGSNTMWFAVCWLSPERDLVVVAAANAADDEARRACDRAVSELITRFPALGRREGR